MRRRSHRSSVDAGGSKIAATVTVTRSAGRGGDVKRLPTCEAVVVGERLLDDRAASAERGDDGVRRPSLQSQLYDRPMRPGSMPSTVTSLPNAFAWSWRTAEATSDAGSARSGRARPRPGSVSKPLLEVTT